MARGVSCFFAPKRSRMAGQERDVSPPFPQRRQPDGEAVQPVVKVLAEASFLHLRLHVLVRGGDDADVGADRARAADAEDLPGLDGAEQLHLHGGGDLADLVQEQHALVRDLEQAGLAHDRAGERALLVAEQLALQQAFRHGGAVDGDEGLRGARARGVDGPGDQLLAGAAFALDEDGQVGARDPGDGRHQLLHPRVLGDHAEAALLLSETDLQRGVLAPQA